MGQPSEQPTTESLETSSKASPEFFTRFKVLDPVHASFLSEDLTKVILKYNAIVTKLNRRDIIDDSDIEEFDSKMKEFRLSTSTLLADMEFFLDVIRAKKLKDTIDMFRTLWQTS